LIDLKKKFLIYGYGVSGKSIAKYLKNKNSNYQIYDDNKIILNSDKVINKNLVTKNINKFDYFVVSPSIKIDKNHFLFKYKNKILIDLDFLSLEFNKHIIIGITGTEGKSTTCQYLSQTISRKYKNIILGNFGNTILDKINIQKYINTIDIIIIELSSYQLDKIKYLRLDHALITNIYSDHINYHKSYYNYVKAKFKIQSILKKNGSFHINHKDFISYQKLINLNKFKIYKFKNKIALNESLDKQMMLLNQPAINSMIKIIDNSLTLDKPLLKNLPFRNELIKSNNKLKIYNDSKCTNIENAVMKNNLILSNNKILILGGKPKIFHKKIIMEKTLILIFGNYAYQISRNLVFKNSNFFIFNDLQDLISFTKIIIDIFRYNTILFSPGGESFDLFKSFNERGVFFNSLIKKLKF
jgi:UDP-N-acetylmuramoylalanine--D-glutamate ligase